MATIAVFLGLGGGAYAALKLPQNSVGTNQIRKNAVRSGEVKNNALSGKDVVERRLGIVPNASNANHALEADHAANADLLAGNGVGAFVPADRLIVAKTTAHWVLDGSETGERTESVLEKGPFTIRLRCRYSANTQATVLVTTTAAKSTLTRSGDGVVFGPDSAAQALVETTVIPGGTGMATNGVPFALYSTSDETYLAGHVAVFAQDAGLECRSVLSAISG